MIVSDWKGILFFIVAILCLFIRSGILIDADNKKLKRYTGFFAIKTGQWENINDLIRLHIVKIQETQSIHVLSITRNETKDVLKLMMVLPGKKIELMSGEKETILNRAEKTSLALQVPVPPLV